MQLVSFKAISLGIGKSVPANSVFDVDEKLAERVLKERPKHVFQFDKDNVQHAEIAKAQAEAAKKTNNKKDQ